MAEKKSQERGLEEASSCSFSTCQVLQSGPEGPASAGLSVSSAEPILLP